MTGGMWPVFTDKWYGPCRVMYVDHPRYTLQSSNGRHTPRPIHSKRLTPFRERGPDMQVTETPRH
jgi:hypothetical protein